MRGDERRVEPPALQMYSDVPIFNTKAVVHQTGVPAPTLRAWERRYGILSPQRGGNDYRLYSERDIVTVVWLRERVQTGMTISQAIALLKNLQTAGSFSRATTPGSSSGGVRVASQRSALQPMVPQYSLVELRATLIAALVEFDEVAARRAIADALAAHAVEQVCTHLLAPVLVEIGQRWSHGEANVVVEHFASTLIRSQLESLFRNTSEFDVGPLALVGCASGEQHEIGALMFALFLRRAGVRTAFLGQNVETASLLQSIHTLRPAAVVLVAVMTEHMAAVSEVARRIAALPSPAPIFGFGGPAFMTDADVVESIPGLFLDADLTEATTALCAHLAG